MKPLLKVDIQNQKVAEIEAVKKIAEEMEDMEEIIKIVGNGEGKIVVTGEAKKSQYN